jgi:hypothetical protein
MYSLTNVIKIPDNWHGMPTAFIMYFMLTTFYFTKVSVIKELNVLDDKDVIGREL